METIRKTRELMEGWDFWLDREGRERALTEEAQKRLSRQTVRLPHDWAVSRPFDREMPGGASQGYRNRYGIGWYKKRFTLREKRGGSVYRLEFGGIFEDSTVWVNGEYAGGRKYGYSSFCLDVTPMLRTGENEILVRVDNTALPSDRWYSGAGIYRSVRLTELSERHLDEREIRVATRLEGRDAVVSVDPGCGDEAVFAEVRKDGFFAGAQKKDGLLEIRIPGARLWSAETPELYDLSVGIRGEDCVNLRIGVREIELVPGKGMFVNGERVILRGVCMHQEAGCLGIAVPKEIYRERLETLKRMGCNALRPAHHTFSEEFLDLCDEMGFYVYEECFDKWHGGLYGRYFDTEWQRDVDSMIKRDRNRPCICLWGIGNEVENQGQDSMLATLKLLTDYARTLDTRPVSYAMNPHFKREGGADVKDAQDIQKFVDEVSETEIFDCAERVERIAGIARYVDVISCNYQEQWYSMIHKRLPEKLILGTEIYQFFQGHEDQIQNFTGRIPSLVPESADYVIGGMIWTGYDYLGESMGYPSKGWSGALIRTNGVKKPGYYIMKSLWNSEPCVHFFVRDDTLPDEMIKEHWDLPHMARHWHFPQYRRTLIPYTVVSNCEEVRVELNGKRFYTEQPSRAGGNLICGYLPWEPGEVTVRGFSGGREVCRESVKTPDIAVKLAFEEERICMEQGSERVLRVRAYDRENRPCFRESAEVYFEAEGAAEILGTDSGNLMSSEPYQEQSVHMYQGCAGAAVRMTGNGRARIRAYASGMETGEIILYSPS